MGTLRVRNVAQKVLWEQELSGQISDGQWENGTPWNHWEPWCGATVVVDPDNVGRDFYARRESYNFTNKDLLDVVGERMLDAVRVLTGNAEYSMTDMRADLNDLKKIIKENVRPGVPIPKQPRTWKAKLMLDGYPAEYECFVFTDDDPRAASLLEKREREQAAYRLKHIDKRIDEARASLQNLEDERAMLRQDLGMLV